MVEYVFVVNWYAYFHRGISHDALLSHLHMLDHHSALYVLHCLTPLAKYEEHKVLELLQRTGIRLTLSQGVHSNSHRSADHFNLCFFICRRSFVSGLTQLLCPAKYHSVSRLLCHEVCPVRHLCECTHAHRLPGL